jgi:methylenetetrahydrofolate dehydrogenase (NADP+)/methenyltetrahydrofolate cyclohydrolase
MPVKEAVLLEGKILAAKIQEEIKQSAAISGQPWLISIQAGDDRASDWYIGQQEKLAAKLGIHFERAAAKDQKELLHKIRESNMKFHGIFLAMPMPQGFNADEALLMLDPRKDVEGIHPTSLGLIVLRKSKLIPPTAYAALLLMEHAVKDAGKSLRGMKVAIAGQSAIVGRPLQLLLGERRATTVVCNTGTTPADLEKFVSESDVVVACAGQPGFIKGAWIKPGAIVIDVGTTEVEGNLVGDVEFEEAKKRASYITPVPGGVGPLTVTMLMQNLMHAYQWQKSNP